MRINQGGSGSFKLDQTFLASQLDPQGPKTGELSSSSSERPPAVEVNQRAFADLTNFRQFEVNGKSPYKDPGYEDRSELEKAQHVFQSLESQLGSTSAAVNATHLASAELRKKALEGVAHHKGMSFVAENGQIKHKYTLARINQTSVLSSDGKTFKLKHKERIIYAENDPNIPGKPYKNDWSDIGHMKVKTVIKGPLEALKNGEASKMTIKTSFTKNCQTFGQAEKAPYGGKFEKSQPFHIPQDLPELSDEELED